LQQIQAGVQDYLIKREFDNSQLIRSLRYAIARQQYTHPTSNQLEFACQCDADKINWNTQIISPPLQLSEHQPQRWEHIRFASNILANRISWVSFQGANLRG
jgi:DNA-binding NarL/FixJ family response regulator